MKASEGVKRGEVGLFLLGLVHVLLIMIQCEITYVSQ